MAQGKQEPSPEQREHARQLWNSWRTASEEEIVEHLAVALMMAEELAVIEGERREAAALAQLEEMRAAGVRLVERVQAATEHVSRALKGVT